MQNLIKQDDLPVCPTNYQQMEHFLPPTGPGILRIFNNYSAILLIQ